jgi:hypothetical protein
MSRTERLNCAAGLALSGMVRIFQRIAVGKEATGRRSKRSRHAEHGETLADHHRYGYMLNFFQLSTRV